MLTEKKRSLTSVQIRLLKEKKKKRLDKQREVFTRQQAEARKKIEEDQRRRYEELKQYLKEVIYDTPGMMLISEEENYMLIAKSTNLSVNIHKNANPFQPFHKEKDASMCIISLIDYGPKKKCSELYEELMEVPGCKVYRVSHIADVDYIFKQLDQIEL